MKEQSFWDRPWDEVTFSELKREVVKEVKLLALELPYECLSDMSDEMLSDTTNDVSVMFGLMLKDRLAKHGPQIREKWEKISGKPYMSKGNAKIKPFCNGVYRELLKDDFFDAFAIREELRTAGKEIEDFSEKLGSHEFDRDSSVTENRQVLSMGGSFLRRMTYGFPKAKVTELKDEELYHEYVRSSDILGVMCKANGFDSVPPVELAFDRDVPTVEVRDFYVGGKRETKILVNPFFASKLDDDKLAMALGHELAHVACHHSEEMALFRKAYGKLNDAYSLDDGDFGVLASSLARYQEFEADRYGCLFAENAKYATGKRIPSANHFMFESDRISDSLRLLGPHPSFAERNMLLRNTDLSKVAFSRERRDARIREMRGMVGTVGGCARLQSKLLGRSLRVARVDNCIFRERIAKIKNLPPSAKVKYLPFLKGLAVANSSRTTGGVPAVFKYRGMLNDEIEGNLAVLRDVSKDIVKSVSVSEKLKRYADVVRNMKVSDLAVETARAVGL